MPLSLLRYSHGASAEGGPYGSLNEMCFFNNAPETVEGNQRIKRRGWPERLEQGEGILQHSDSEGRG